MEVTPRTSHVSSPHTENKKGDPIAPATGPSGSPPPSSPRSRAGPPAAASLEHPGNPPPKKERPGVGDGDRFNKNLSPGLGLKGIISSTCASLFLLLLLLFYLLPSLSLSLDGQPFKSGTVPSHPFYMEPEVRC